MMAWDLLESVASEHGPLELYSRGMKEYMIRFDGIELMNGLLHISEDVLGELSVALCHGKPGALLIGGLGLGFTLAAAMTSRAALPLAQQPTLAVAELTPTIINWYQRHFCHALGLAPDAVPLIAGDAYQTIADGGKWRVICLDIDNGPSYLSTHDNQKMYALSGLQNISNHLEADGACLVWSANEEPDLIANARQQGFFVYLRYVHSQMAARVFEQYIYVLSRCELAAPFCQAQQLHPQQ